MKTLFLLFAFIIPLSAQNISQEVADFDVHTSSIVATKSCLLVAYNGGHGKGLCNCEMTENVGIYVTRLTNGAWSTPTEIACTPQSKCWNPVLTTLPSGEVLLFYKVGKDPRHWVGMMKRSKDEGATWEKDEMLPAGVLGPTKNKPIVQDGKLICGSSEERNFGDSRATSLWIEIATNNATTWQKYGPIVITERPFGAIEPVLFAKKDGSLCLFARDRAHKVGGTGFIWSSTSKDGINWSRLEKTALPNPDSGFDIVRLKNGNLLLAYNHSHTNRYPLTLALSKDDGISWTHVKDLETSSGEFPAMIVDNQGKVHLTYACIPEGKEQRRIKYETFSQE